MKTIKLIVSVLSITWLLSSCSPVYYEPSSHNVPLLEEKGDFNIGGSANLLLNKGEVQASYAVTNHIGVMTNYMMKRYLFNNSGSDTRISQMFEAGAGLFHNPNDRFVLEAYGIFGRGSFDNRLTGLYGGNRSLSGDMTKYTLQLSVGYRDKGLELAYSMRPTILKFSNLTGDFDFGDRDQRTLLTNQDSYTSIEHALTVRFVYEHVKLQYQLGKGGRQFAEGNHRLDIYLTIGISVNLRKLRENNSTKEMKRL